MKTVRLASSVFGAFVALLVLAPLSAADVTISASAPASGVLASNTPKEPAATVGWKNDSSGNQWTGVTFTVSETLVLDKISLAYTSAGSGVANAAVSLRIVQLNSGGSVDNQLQNATLLQTDQFTLPGTIASSGYLTFDLKNITLTASSNSYAYILSFDSSASNRLFSLTRGTPSISGTALSSSSSPNYVFRSDNGGASYYNLGFDNAPLLSLQGTVASQIPEPSTWAALVGLIALGAAGLKRRVRR